MAIEKITMVDMDSSAVLGTPERLFTDGRYNEIKSVVNNNADETDAKVTSIQAGDNITVDNADPKNPIIASTGGGGGIVEEEISFSETVLFDDGYKYSIHNQVADIALTLATVGTTGGSQKRTYYIYGNGTNSITTDFDIRIKGDVLVSNPVIYNKLEITYNGDLPGDVINKIDAINTQVVVAEDVTSGLVFKYPLTTDALDTSGNGNDGTVNGAVTFVNDDIRGAVAEFDGDTTSTYIQSPVNNTASYTRCVWARIPDLVTNNQQTLFGGNGSGVKSICWLTGGAVKAGGNLSLTTVSAGGAEVNNWAYYAVTYDSGTNEIKIYKNGIMIQQGTESDSVNSPILLGRYSNDATQLRGKESDFRNYDRALTDNEILSLYYLEKK